MNAVNKAEALGNECGMELLGRLLACTSQSEACPEIHSFLTALCSEPKKLRSEICAGVSTALVDVLMLGMAVVRARSAQ